ncbi:hypothetical protein HanPI659440_Chr16g0660931 [Helianthus annuus]|nr:hypothetical protein HanPI659440_Chr16g0660931 [Helianthus annuus]
MQVVERGGGGVGDEDVNGGDGLLLRFVSVLGSSAVVRVVVHVARLHLLMLETSYCRCQSCSLICYRPTWRLMNGDTFVLFVGGSIFGATLPYSRSFWIRLLMCAPCRMEKWCGPCHVGKGLGPYLFRVLLSFHINLTEKTNPHPRQGLSRNEITKVGDYSCNFRKLGTKGEK